MALELLADSYGLTQQEADDGAVLYWRMACEQAKRDVANMHAAIAKDAYAMKGVRTAIGHMICEMDGREYLWLKEQYGEEIVRDRDFLLFYQKHRGQTFLPTPSKELWN